MGPRLAFNPLGTMAVSQGLRALALGAGQRAHVLAGLGRLRGGVRTGVLPDAAAASAVALLAVPGRDLLRDLPDARAVRTGHQAHLPGSLAGDVPRRRQRGAILRLPPHYSDCVYRG